ncbi:MAG: sugar phosphate isomerase/epimerase [Clostridia bacterium]|nr:sugar phosphate isomerase/epimerase [Oscillospiraceae bacterium]MBR6748339.1 sugar phosphate isomerase/epimerase [Clostridia bacterium]
MAYNNTIGIIQNLRHFFDAAESDLLDQMVDAGLESVQVLANDSSLHLMTPENAEKLMKMLDGKLRITSFWCGWSGPNVWNFVDGPGTLGLVPEAYRAIRLEELKRGADFARLLGVHDMATHVGFVPEQPCYQGYRELVAAIAHIAEYCAARDLHFNFETGQETPVTLMRLFSDVGADNLGVNLDPANLILYGRGNPVDALDIYGDKIRGVHVKDGVYPSGDFHRLGRERVVGEGAVNFPVFLPKLLGNGYKGDLYIEREITGAQRCEDIKKTIKYLHTLMA